MISATSINPPQQEEKTLINAEDHLGLVRFVCANQVRIPHGVPLIDTEEYSDGVVGLLRAISKYDSTLNIEFSTYAIDSIKNAIILGWRKRGRKKRFCNSCSLDELGVEKFTQVPTKNYNIEKFFQDDPEDTETDKRNKGILYDHFINGQSWAEIAREMGVSRAAVQQFGVAAINLIRKKFEVNEFQSFDDFLNEACSS